MNRPDVVRRLFAAVDARDVPAMLATLDPSITFEPVLGILYTRHVFEGHEGMTAWVKEQESSWDSFENLVEDAVEDGDRVIAFLRLVGHRGTDDLDAEIAVEVGFTGDRISSIVGREAWEVAEELGRAGPPGA